MNIIPLPALSDNYIWILHDDAHALVVDPGDATVVLHWLQSHPDLQLDTVLVTHHHADHTAGVATLAEKTGASLYAPVLEPLPLDHRGVQTGDQIHWHGMPIRVIDVPGHTAGHVAYWCQPPGVDPVLFCGDTLFSAGCGRLFEGTAAQMQQSLDQLAALPAATRVCCAHEYTLSNLRFALAVEPDNLEISTFHRECQSLRDRGQPTLPARLSRELAINPFLRTRHPAVRAMAEQQAGHALLTADAVLGQLREWKNRF